jgi:hypothetical protein
MKNLMVIVVAMCAYGALVGFAQGPVAPGPVAPGAPAPGTSAAAPATSPTAIAAAKAEQELQKAEKERFDAMVNADLGTLDRLLGAELSYTHSNAQVQDKGSFISDIRAKNIRYLSIEPSDVHVALFGTTAVVTGGAAVHVIENGNDLTIKIRYTDVHLNRRGEWQMVAWQATRVP